MVAPGVFLQVVFSHFDLPANEAVAGKRVAKPGAASKGQQRS